MKKVYALLNSVIIVGVIIWNYWSNTGNINGNTVGSLSEEYTNLFTPAGYAFAIWGLIFLALLMLGFFQLIWAFRGGTGQNTITQIGPWLAIANLGNVTWLWFWLTENTGWSVVVMFVILISLLMVIWRLNMEKWDAPRVVIAFVWWPVCFYSGWITVATIANVAAYLAKIGWIEWISEVQWTIVMISVAGILNILMIYFRNMREFAVVGVWALVAIAVRHWGQIEPLQWTALGWSCVITLIIAWHGYRRRRSNPFYTAIFDH